MSKWTPGPWKVIDDDTDYIAITDEEQQFGICRIEEVASESRLSMKANASLIAAAPEMLEAFSKIARKVPFKVSREEAADMACEFQILAAKMVKKARGES